MQHAIKCNSRRSSRVREDRGHFEFWQRDENKKAQFDCHLQSTVFTFLQNPIFHFQRNSPNILSYFEFDETVGIETVVRYLVPYQQIVFATNRLDCYLRSRMFCHYWRYQIYSYRSTRIGMRFGNWKCRLLQRCRQPSNIYRKASTAWSALGRFFSVSW